MRKMIAFVAAVTLSLVMSGKVLACNKSEGEVTKIDKAKKTVVVSAKAERKNRAAKVTTYTLKDSTKVTINGKDASLADIKDGDKVMVHFEATDDVLKLMVTRDS